MRKLVAAIVQIEDVDALMNALVALGERATQVASTGGFLVRDSALVLCCVAPHRVASVLSAIRDTCRRRTTLAVPPSVEYGPLTIAPLEIEVGGAVVFVLDVEQATFLAAGAGTRAG